MWNQPSRIASAVAPSFSQYPAITLRPRAITSPTPVAASASSIFTSMPGSGRPTEPAIGFSLGEVTVRTGAVSVRPYPSKKLNPIP